MKRAWTLTRLEIKSLFVGFAVPAGCLGILLAGVYGLYSGETSIRLQQAVLEESPKLYEAHQSYVLSRAPDSAPAGDLLYYTFLHTHHEPSSWAPFALGGRDVHPFNLKVRLLTLEGQLYDSELTNPMALFYGNFDASFVIIALFPLLVIALTYGLISDEEESGAWKLVLAQGPPVAFVLATKLGVRLGCVLALAIAIVALGGLRFGAPWTTIVETAAVASGYLVLWFGACSLVVAFRRSSPFNAIALLTLWLVWTVVGPSLANVVIATAMPVPEALEVTVRQRQGYHESWDRPQGEVMDNFYRSYPSYASYPIPDDRFSTGWYFAMNQMGDDEARKLAEAYRATIERRQELTDRVASFFPPVLAQRGFNRIARTDLESHLDYLDSVRAYHEELKAFFFPIVFREDPKGSVDWTGVPRHWHSDVGRARSSLDYVLVLSLLAAALFGAGFLRLGARAAATT